MSGKELLESLLGRAKGMDKRGFRMRWARLAGLPAGRISDLMNGKQTEVTLDTYARLSNAMAALEAEAGEQVTTDRAEGADGAEGAEGDGASSAAA